MFDLSYLELFLSLNILGFNWLDVIMVIIFGFYIYEGYQLGFILSLFDFLSFALSFIVALKWYDFVGTVLVKLFNMPIGFAHAIGFFILALIVEVITNLLLRQLVYKRLVPIPGTNLRFDTFRKVDHYLGAIPGAVSALILISFLLTLIVALPSSPLFKQLVTNSRLGSLLVSKTAIFEGDINGVFGDALHETMNFMTVEPKSNETIVLTLHCSQRYCGRAS